MTLIMGAAFTGAGQATRKRFCSPPPALGGLLCQTLGPTDACNWLAANSALFHPVVLYAAGPWAEGLSAFPVSIPGILRHLIPYLALVGAFVIGSWILPSTF